MGSKIKANSAKKTEIVSIFTPEVQITYRYSAYVLDSLVFSLNIRDFNWKSFQFMASYGRILMGWVALEGR